MEDSQQVPAIKPSKNLMIGDTNPFLVLYNEVGDKTEKTAIATVNFNS